MFRLFHAKDVSHVDGEVDVEGVAVVPFGRLVNVVILIHVNGSHPQMGLFRTTCQLGNGQKDEAAAAAEEEEEALHDFPPGFLIARKNTETEEAACLKCFLSAEIVGQMRCVLLV